MPNVHLPEQFELISFFGAEPVLRVPGVPWDYNGLTFEAGNESERIRCHIEMDVGAVSLQWWTDERQQGGIELKWVGDIRLEEKHSRYVLIFDWIAGNPDLSIELQVNPVSVRVVACPSKP